MPEKNSLHEAQAHTKKLIEHKLLHDGSPAAGVLSYLADSAGKGLRAKLLLCAAQDELGYVSPAAITAAAAVELLHLATLLHDDVIDDADTRRGLPSAQKKFGKKAAVICGDYLLTQCFSLVARIAFPFADKFERAVSSTAKICVGEMRQFRHNWDLSLTPMEYLRTCSGKTAALFSFSLYSGSILGGYDEIKARDAGRVGTYIGMAFQLDDDCLDYSSDAGLIKKNAQNDLVEGVVTLPLIFAIAKDPSLRDMIGRDLLTAEAILAVVARVIQLGGVEQTREIARRYHKKAEITLLRWPDSVRRASLLQALEEIRGRRL